MPRIISHNPKMIPISQDIIRPTGPTDGLMIWCIESLYLLLTHIIINVYHKREGAQNDQVVFSQMGKAQIADSDFEMIGY